LPLASLLWLKKRLRASLRVLNVSPLQQPRLLREPQTKSHQSGGVCLYLHLAFQYASCTQQSPSHIIYLVPPFRRKIELVNVVKVTGRYLKLSACVYASMILDSV
jgi:hypothetical protein